MFGTRHIVRGTYVYQWVIWVKTKVTISYQTNCPVQKLNDFTKLCEHTILDYTVQVPLKQFPTHSVMAVFYHAITNIHLGHWHHGPNTWCQSVATPAGDEGGTSAGRGRNGRPRPTSAIPDISLNRSKAIACKCPPETDLAQNGMLNFSCYGKGAFSLCRPTTKHNMIRRVDSEPKNPS